MRTYQIALIPQHLASIVREFSKTKRARDVFISDEATEALRDRRSVNYCVIYGIREATG
jgi:hypothetical protein